MDLLFSTATTTIAVTDPNQTENRNLSHSMGDAAFFGGMVGCGETYFPAFALAIGLGETASGLVASIPLLVGGTLQLASPIAIRWLGSYQRWIVTGAVLQALAFIPLALAAWSGSLTLPMFLLIASVYWAAGLATGPAWNTWIERIVPPSRRTRFFARRSRLQQICTFSSLMIAGTMLQWSSANDATLSGFAGLFVVAGLLRLVSAMFLHRTDSQVADIVPSINISSAAQAVDHSNRVSREAKRLLAYLVLMQVFVQISGPFFAAYMLEQLSFSYSTFVTLISVAFVSKVLSMSFWGRIAERSGARRVLWIGGVCLVPLSSLWILSEEVAWLVVVQILSGIAWAAYELGFFLMFFETLPAGQRTRLLTYYNFANTLAVCAGALCGAAVLGWVGYSSYGYHYLFGLSSLGRLLCVGLLVGIALPNHSLKTIQMRILSIRPGAGSVATPVLASAEEEISS
jgi:MFS family permease